MPFCCVFGCSNTSNNPPGTSVHRFPRDDAVAAQWVAAIKRDNLPERFRETCVVCSAHFKDQDFERDLKGELLGRPSPRTLRPTAVPFVLRPGEGPPAKRRKSAYVEKKETDDL